MTNPTAHTLTSPKLVSAALAGINTQLQAALPWLTYAFGQGQRLTKKTDNNQTTNYPAIYTGGAGDNDYLTLLPDEHLAQSGGFSWWDVSSPIEQQNGLNENTCKFQAGLVVWFDFRRVYASGNWKEYDTWNVAQDVLNKLYTLTGNAELADPIQISDRTERIYPGLSSNEIDRQYNMRPYGCFRIDMTIFWNNFTC